MDHFLSSLEPGANPWYSPRPPVAPHGHEFAIGTSSFQLIPIASSANHGSSNPHHNNHHSSNHYSNSTTTTNSTNSSQPLSHSAFKPPAHETPKVKSEAKDDEELIISNSPSPSVARPPLSTNMAHHSHKAKNVISVVQRGVSETDICYYCPDCERWDTKKVCNICGKVLSRGDKLKNHIRTHTNNYPFHCDTCGQGFLRSEGLRVHTRVHTGERPYGCIVCGKTYTRKDKLTRHAIVHTGERPFVCPHCGKTFTRKDKMQRHEMIHKVEKPFTCVPCNLEFVRQETFNAHMERKHPERLPYTVVQHSRANSPSYHPQGLNLADSKSSGASKIHSSKTPVTTSATSIGSHISALSTLPSSTSILPSGSHLSSSLLAPTSLLTSSAMASNMALHGSTIAHHHLS